MIVTIPCEYSDVSALFVKMLDEFQDARLVYEPTYGMVAMNLARQKYERWFWDAGSMFHCHYVGSSLDHQPMDWCHMRDTWSGSKLHSFTFQFDECDYSERNAGLMFKLTFGGEGDEPTQ